MVNKKKIRFDFIFYIILPVFLVLGGIRSIVTGEFKMWSKIVAIGSAAQIAGGILIILGIIFSFVLIKYIRK